MACSSLSYMPFFEHRGCQARLVQIKRLLMFRLQNRKIFWNFCIKIRRRGKLSMETLAYFISKARCLSNVKAESITDESLESNCSIIENIPPKGVSFLDFIATFTVSV